jgi:hypothetical protein
MNFPTGLAARSRRAFLIPAGRALLSLSPRARFRGVTASPLKPHFKNYETR